jgi:hypothetical protein
MLIYDRRGSASARPSEDGKRGRRSNRYRGLWSSEPLEARVLLSGGPTIYTVDAITDTGAGSGTTGDLLYCVEQANANANNAGSVIQFDPTLFATPQTITLTSTLALSETGGPEVLCGPGASLVTISGNSSVEVLSVSGAVTATIAGLTISGGSAVQGGGMFNLGTTTVTNCTMADNSQVGVDNYYGSLLISNSTVAGNSGVYGGGIFNNLNSTTVISDSTIAGNSASYGGGIDNYGTLTVTNSTIADNSAFYGGGIYDRDNATTVITAATIAQNSAENGGGILNLGQMLLDNTIVAQNTGAIGDLSGTVASSSAYNLIGIGGSAGLLNGVNGNQVGVAQPGLAADLADNGGPTLTIALLPVSPAIGAGSTNLAVNPDSGQPLAYDQRGPGFARVVGGAVDIGAFELQSAPASLTVTQQPPSSVTTVSDFSLTVTAMTSPGVVDTSFNGPVSVALANNPGDATLGGMLTVTASNGVACFSALTINLPQTGYTLQVSSTGMSAATTDAFNVQTVVAAAAVSWGTQTAPVYTASDGMRLLPAGRETDMPWLGIDQVPIALAQATSLAAADVTVSSAIGANYGPVTVSGSGTSYTITLTQPIEAADRVTITIADATIATFTRQLDVLPGDFNDDGRVDGQDLVGVRDEWLRIDGAVPTIFGDINGDGVVDAIDYDDVLEHLHTTLPSVGGASNVLGLECGVAFDRWGAARGGTRWVWSSPPLFWNPGE